MVIHDANTKRTSMGKSQLEIAGSTSEELRKIDVGTFKNEAFAGEKIPFIDEILHTIPEGKTLVIEIKCGPEVLPALQKAIKESGKINQLVFISFGWETILETQKVFGNNQCYYLKMLPFGLNRKMKLAAQNGLAGVNLYHGIVNKRVIKKAKKLDIEVLAWTVDDAKTAKKLNKLGVQKITTNRPKWLKDQLENN
jgi:glycerophosphoryl diester phosphodiesterase